MPSKIVKIEWDTPDDPDWLDELSIELAIGEFCPDTVLIVTGVEDTDIANAELLEICMALVGCIYSGATESLHVPAELYDKAEALVERLL